MSQFSGSTFGRYTRLWLIITGVILLAVGGVMAITLGNVPFAGGAMILTGGILAAVGIALIVIGLIVGRRAAATDQILQTGTAGQATITGLTQTGMYLNENPQIEMNLLVSLPNQVPYAARRKEFVPLMLLGRLTSGAPLAVRVDPMDLSKVVIDWGASGFAARMPMMGMAPMAGQMGGMPMAGQPVAGAQPPASGTAASGMDESLAQVQAALAQSGMQAATPFASAAQGNLTVEQLRAYLRQSGLEAGARIDKADRQDGGFGQGRRRRAPVHHGDDAHDPRPLGAEAAFVGGDGAGGQVAQALPGNDRAGALRGHQPQPADGRVGQDLNA